MLSFRAWRFEFRVLPGPLCSIDGRGQGLLYGKFKGNQFLGEPCEFREGDGLLLKWVTGVSCLLDCWGGYMKNNPDIH